MDGHEKKIKEISVGRQIRIWEYTDEDAQRREEFLNMCAQEDGRLPLLNLPEEPLACDGCLMAEIGIPGKLIGILTSLLWDTSCEISALVHPDFRGQGVFTALYEEAAARIMHKFLPCGKSVAEESPCAVTFCFPVEADDRRSIEFLSHLGKTESQRELLLSLRLCDRNRIGKMQSDPIACAGARASSAAKFHTRPMCIKKKLSPPADGLFLSIRRDETGEVSSRPTNDTASDPASEPDVNGKPGSFSYTLMRKGIPAGFCVVSEGCLHHMEIRPCCRGRGFGTYFLSRILSHQEHLGTEELFLHVSSRNCPALRLYESQGFQIQSEIAFYE